MGQNSSMGQFTRVSLKLLPPKIFIFNDIDDSDWPMANTTVCTLLVSKINSGVPCPQGPQLNVSEQLLRDVKAAASRRNNDLRVAREEAAANNDVAVVSEDESDDE